MQSTPNVATDHEHNAVDGFSDCHAGILEGLLQFATLPPLADAARRAREVAAHAMALLDEAVQQHHAEEEEELFTAVVRSARPGAERERVEALVAQLTEEHRDVESLWKRVRPEVVKLAAGKPAQLREDAAELLLDVYRQHANFEERAFLPLAQEILGRNDNHMAALGLSLHMRHRALPVGYI